MFFLLYVCVLCSAVVVEAGSAFDGFWHLDRSRDAGSMEQVLELMGVGYIKRRIIANMDIEEQYELTPTAFRIARYTAYGEQDNAYVLGQAQDSEDALLGAVRALVHAGENQGRVQIVLTRLSDQAVLHSVRRIVRESPNQLVYAVNFTLADGQKAACVRHYVRKTRR